MASSNITFNFANKRALVTGASKGIGYAVLLALAKSGAEVVGIARNVDSINEIQKKHPELKVQGIICDLSDWNITRQTIENLGRFDFLVNNAGINIREKFFDIKEESIDKVFNLNYKAALNASQVGTKMIQL